ncbi:MAG TPA: glutamate 5-kinase [Candidatus Sumerlaeota bacterium]|nr:glutamate 5-kinase [Candidatus Sumerlaeota bacterium]HOR28047.1 glutamate 5-kinase [Candidatus Sumerlaeota bacterium]HPK01117.1 glutamate 5-kinase [Candidatus Sumerlaeota bacterium]
MRPTRDVQMIHIDNIQGTGRGIDLRKVVIKLGSAVVAGEGHQLDLVTLGALADSVANLRRQGVDVILVSSGAIGMGRRAFPDFTARTIPDRQALAAIGQVGLMHAYKTLFNARDLRAAQILLTRDDMEDRRRYLNARYTLERLLELGAVPVINENDTVTIDELQFGDNDELSAVVAIKMGADMLIILSIVDGLHEAEADPTDAGARGRKRKGRHAAGRRIDVVESVDDVLGLADRTRSAMGTGGMQSKLKALHMASQAGVHAVIAPGKRAGIVEEIVSGRFPGTYFVPRVGHRLRGKPRWLAFGRRATGRCIVIDAGAVEALRVGKKSLLAAGVRAVRGQFERGDLVEVHDEAGARVAKGLTNYSAEELDRIKGKRTPQIREILGELDYPEVIHRDNLAVVD